MCHKVLDKLLLMLGVRSRYELKKDLVRMVLVKRQE